MQIQIRQCVYLWIFMSAVETHFLCYICGTVGMRVLSYMCASDAQVQQWRDRLHGSFWATLSFTFALSQRLLLLRYF